MATVRHLGLFALRPTPIVERPRCAQPAANFLLPTENGIIATNPPVIGPTTYSVGPVTLPDSQYIPLTLERAMRWHWRIKKWKVQVDVQLQFDGPEDIYPIQGEFFVNNTNGFANYEQENQKVCDAGLFQGAISVSEDSEEPMIYLGDWTCGVSIGDQQTAWANYPNTPEILISGLSQSVRISEDELTYYIPVVIDLSMRTIDSISDYTSGQIAQNVAGEDKPLIFSINDGTETITRHFRYGGSDEGSIAISVEEYWPYDPNDGDGPIYDSATGQQLRPFPQ
jgi:hypothetical protein